ncbi:MAG: SlyX family protein [Porticoccaceae bacterium]
MSHPDHQRLETIEEKVAYLELSNTQMSEEIFRQQQEIETLTRAHQQLRECFELLREATEKTDSEGLSLLSDRPPHY